MTRNSIRLYLLFAALAAAQESGDPDVRTRKLWDTTLMDKRPAPGKRPPTASSSLVKGALIGVTVWRLRPSKPGDAHEVRSLIHGDAGKTEEWTPERVAADTPLAEGQKVRISVEAAESGYLYVVDRDEYADGAKGDAMLIFPTRHMRGGDNRVSAGVVVEIPGADDDPPHFNVTRSRPDQINEVLTILVSPKPIAGLRIGNKPLKLTEEQVSSWEKQWKAKAYKLEAQGEEGKAYTVAEKQAASGGKPLTKGDPAPQTMYRVDCKPRDTVMLQLPLKIAK